MGRVTFILMVADPQNRPPTSEDGDVVAGQIGTGPDTFGKSGPDTFAGTGPIPLSQNCERLVLPLGDLDDPRHSRGNVPFDMAVKEPAAGVVGFPDAGPTADRPAR